MRRAWSLLLAICLSVGWPAEPAEAWGSYTHVWVAERAYGVLVAAHPWLAAHRDAFLWGSVAGDLDASPDLGRPSHARTHSATALGALWKEAIAGKDQGAQAFALGWAVHLGADEVAPSAFKHQGVREALTHAGATRLPGDLSPLIEWAVDAALVPKSDGTLFSLYRSTVVNAGTPAGAPLRRVLERVFGTDEATYMAWARLQASMSAGNVDRYLAERSRFVRVEPWTEPLRAPGVRQSLGNLTPVMTRAVDAGVKRAKGLLAPPRGPLGRPQS